MSTSTEPAPSGEGVITRTAKKTLLTTNNPFEKHFGYHRAVRRGQFICVSGTTAVELSKEECAGDQKLPSSIMYPGDSYKQAELAMKRCLQAVTDLDGKATDVVRVKMFVAKYEDCGAVGDAYKTVFGGGQSKSETNDDLVGAAATMIVVPGGFVDEDMLVEVEVDAYCC